MCTSVLWFDSTRTAASPWMSGVVAGGMGLGLVLGLGLNDSKGPLQELGYLMVLAVTHQIHVSGFTHMS